MGSHLFRQKLQTPTAHLYGLFLNSPKICLLTCLGEGLKHVLERQPEPVNCLKADSFVLGVDIKRARAE